jgi:hypothetical protein
MPRVCTPFLLIALLASPTLGQDDQPRPDAPKGRIVESNSGIRGFEPTPDESRSTTQQVLSALHPDGRLWYAHVQTLANPWMEGRQPGTRGDDLALNYIQWHLERIGLEPAFITADQTDNDWLQPFSFSLGRQREVVHESVAVGRDTLEPGTDFNTLAISGSDTVTAPITFVGYAIEEGPDGYSSFNDDEDRSLEGRIAVMLRYEPLDNEGHSRWADGNSFSPKSGIRSKFESLVDRGAAGVIMVTPPHAVDGATGLETAQTSRGFGRALDIPVVHMTPEAVDALLRQGGQSLAPLAVQADRGETTTRELSNLLKVTLDTSLERPTLNTHNIGGVLRGQGDLADDWVIVGGHYDHLGYGYVGSRAPGVHAIHPGADDNASGTAAVLVLAERLHHWADAHQDDRRSILFLAFSGEEAGLHGSRYFVDNPSIDTDRASVMVNLDMVGRLRNDTVMLSGTGTAEEFDELLPPHVEPTGLTVEASRGGTGPSDHASFFAGGMPVLFFFTGLHDDYHRPEDEAWTVDPEGGLRIVELADSVIRDIATRDDNLTFVSTNASGPMRRTGAKVRLGIMPAYGADLDTGVLVSSVTAGTSAAEAGLQSDDVLLTWDGSELKGGRDLMAVLRKHSAGDTAKLTIRRNGVVKTVSVTLQGRE